MPPLTTKKEETAMNFDDIEEDDEEIREKLLHDPCDEDDNYDEWDDVTDEPIDEEFLDQMFQRQAMRTESLKPYSYGDMIS